MSDIFIWCSLEKVFSNKIFYTAIKKGSNQLVQDQVNMVGEIEKITRVTEYIPILFYDVCCFAFE